MSSISVQLGFVVVVMNKLEQPYFLTCHDILLALMHAARLPVNVEGRTILQPTFLGSHSQS